MKVRLNMSVFKKNYMLFFYREFLYSTFDSTKYVRLVSLNSDCIRPQLFQTIAVQTLIYLFTKTLRDGGIDLKTSYNNVIQSKSPIALQFLDLSIQAVNSNKV